MEFQFEKYLSYCLKDEKPESEHQFHFMENGEPWRENWENWLLSRLYCDILLDIKFEETIILDDPEEKDRQLRNFLNYHLNYYLNTQKGSICYFVLFLNKIIFELKTAKHADSICDEKKKIYHYTITKWISEVKQKGEKHLINKPIKTELKTNLNTIQLKKLFDLLIEREFISPETKEYNFLYVFGERLPNEEGFKPVKWIKRGKNKDINKASLIELCKLVFDKIEIDKSFFEFAKDHFSTDIETNITLSHNNNPKNQYSQYYSGLSKIVENL